MPQSESQSKRNWIMDLVTQSLPLVARHSRALVVVVGVLALLAIALSQTSPASPFWVRPLGVFLPLGGIFLIVFFLYRLARESTGSEVEGADFDAIRAAVATVNGPWWQIVVNDRSPGISFIHVQLSPLPGRHELSGDKYNREGTPFARWWSRAVALQDIQQIKLAYLWEGSYTKKAGNVSGLGTFEFQSHGGVVARTGGGWFTTGNIDKLDFAIASSILLRRPTAEQVTIMQGEDAEARAIVVTDLYESWSKEIAD